MERATERQKCWQNRYIAVGDVVLMVMTLSAFLVPQLEIEDMNIEPHQNSEIDANQEVGQLLVPPRNGCLRTP